MPAISFWLHAGIGDQRARHQIATASGRTPLKLTITMLPDLSQTLKQYGAFYAATYGREEQMAELVLATLDAFLESERAFVRWRPANRKQAT